MEKVEVFDKSGRKKDYLKERFEDFTNEEYSKVIHIWIKQPDGSYLVQQRAKYKKVDPLHWSMVSGTADPKERLRDTAIRELKEEVGVDIKSGDLIKLGALIPVNDDDPLNNHIATIYLLQKELSLDNLSYQESEVAKCDFWTKEKVLEEVTKGNFTDFTDRYPGYFDFVFRWSENYEY